MTKRARDAQKSRVYSFGWALERQTMNLMDARRLVHEIMPHDTPYVIVDKRLKSTSRADYSNHTIRLQARMVTDVTILHECAHFLTRRRNGNLVAGHGPEFMAHFIQLLAKYTRYDVQTLLDLAYVCRVKVGPAHARELRPRDHVDSLMKVRAKIDHFRSRFSNSHHLPEVRRMTQSVAQGEPMVVHAVETFRSIFSNPIQIEA